MAESVISAVTCRLWDTGLSSYTILEIWVKLAHVSQKGTPSHSLGAEVDAERERDGWNEGRPNLQSPGNISD